VLWNVVVTDCAAFVDIPAVMIISCKHEIWVFKLSGLLVGYEFYTGLWFRCLVCL